MSRRLKFRSFRSSRGTTWGAWTGRTDLAQSLTGGVASAFIIWNGVDSSTLNAPGKLTHQVTYLHMGLRPGSYAAAGVLGWYLYVFTTDETGAVPAAAIFDPLDVGPDVHEKALLDMGLRTVAPTSANAGSSGMQQFTIQRDVQAKRKFDDTDALLLVVESSMDVTNGLDILLRTFARAGR